MQNQTIFPCKLFITNHRWLNEIMLSLNFVHLINNILSSIASGKHFHQCIKTLLYFLFFWLFHPRNLYFTVTSTHLAFSPVACTVHIKQHSSLRSVSDIFVYASFYILRNFCLRSSLFVCLLHKQILVDSSTFIYLRTHNLYSHINMFTVIG